MANRIQELLSVEIPIVQAPMGWIARAQLASAVSNAGGLGIIETSSGELDEVRDEIRKMRDLTDKPFGVNIAQLFVRDPAIVDFVVDQGVRFVTTSAGDPHAVHGAAEGRRASPCSTSCPTLRGRAEGGRRRRRRARRRGRRGRRLQEPATGASTMVLLPLVASKVDVPIIAAGGICDGRVDGGRVRARRRGRADGHPHGVGAPSRRCTTTGSRRSSTPPRPTPCS